MTDDSEFYRKLPRQSRSRSVVNAIIMATDQLLENSGDPTALSLEGVARRAGVGIGSLYDYFANREGLLGALLARITEANFEELAREVQASEKVPFAQAIPRIVERTLDVYLARPERTRGVIRTLIRVGWLKPVVRERDRFAGLLATRLRAEHPNLDAERVRIASEVLCDSVMGVVSSELWRDRPTEEWTRARAELISLIEMRVARLVADG